MRAHAHKSILKSSKKRRRRNQQECTRRYCVYCAVFLLRHSFRVAINQSLDKRWVCDTGKSIANSDSHFACESVVIVQLLSYKYIWILHTDRSLVCVVKTLKNINQIRILQVYWRCQTLLCSFSFCRCYLSRAWCNLLTKTWMAKMWKSTHIHMLPMAWGAWLLMRDCVFVCMCIYMYIYFTQSIRWEHNLYLCNTMHKLQFVSLNILKSIHLLSKQRIEVEAVFRNWLEMGVVMRCGASSDRHEPMALHQYSIY